MSQELIAIITAAIVLAGIIVTGQWAMRRDIAALGESTRKDIAALNLLWIFLCRLGALSNRLLQTFDFAPHNPQV